MNLLATFSLYVLIYFNTAVFDMKRTCAYIIKIGFFSKAALKRTDGKTLWEDFFPFRLSFHLKSSLSIFVFGEPFTKRLMK
jgi:hypothetical protein